MVRGDTDPQGGTAPAPVGSPAGCRVPGRTGAVGTVRRGRGAGRRPGGPLAAAPGSRRPSPGSSSRGTSSPPPGWLPRLSAAGRRERGGQTWQPSPPMATTPCHCHPPWPSLPPPNCRHPHPLPSPPMAITQPQPSAPPPSPSAPHSGRPGGSPTRHSLTVCVRGVSRSHPARSPGLHKMAARRQGCCHGNSPMAAPAWALLGGLGHGSGRCGGPVARGGRRQRQQEPRRCPADPLPAPLPDAARPGDQLPSPLPEHRGPTRPGTVVSPHQR